MVIFHECELIAKYGFQNYLFVYVDQLMYSDTHNMMVALGTQWFNLLKTLWDKRGR